MPVSFKILSGPNAPLLRLAVSDSQGYATMTYGTAGQGADLLQASITNATGASVESNQATVAWSSAGCGSPSPPTPAATTLVYLGPAFGQCSDPLALSALLTDGSGNPLPARMVTFVFGAQTLTAATDATGIARAVVLPTAIPGTVPLTVSFAGDATQPAAQASRTLLIDREDTYLRYTGKAQLGTALPQPVSAVLLDPDSQAPLANKLITFEVGPVQATATTNASGVASTTLTLTPNETSGPAVMSVCPRIKTRT